jgi:hypothetical protein
MHAWDSSSCTVSAVMRSVPPPGIASRALMEVHDNLLELSPVGEDGDHVALHADDELHVGAEQALEHRPHAHDGLGDVDGRRRRGTLAGERQELRRQLRGASGRPLDLLDRVHARLALHLARQDAGVAGDDRHEVVEVVRDAPARRPSDSCADSTTAARLRRCSSTRRSSVTSRPIAEMPTTAPSVPRIGASVKSMVRSVPSGASRYVSNVAEAPCRMLRSSSRRSGVSAVLRGSMMSPR